MSSTMNRKRFVQTGAAVGGGLAMGGPLSALAANTAQGAPRTASRGYGPIAPARDIDTGLEHIALPAGFKYRVISRSGDPSFAWVTDPVTGVASKQQVPTPSIFDGMGAFKGRGGQTILIRNHEYREQPGEQGVVVPVGDRYDENPKYVGGNTRLVVNSQRRVVETTHVLGGTSTNCAGGQTPWGTWITCEETFQAATTDQLRHGYVFEVDASSDRPNPAVPIKAAGCFAHEAVAWWGGILYETEDSGGDSGFYRYVPRRKPREFGDLATTSGPLQAMKRKGSATSFDANTAVVGETFEVEWVTIPDPDPATNTVKTQGTALGKINFARLEGCWVGAGRIYFDSTSGGPAGAGQLWEYNPKDETLRLVYQSTDPTHLQAPDNLVVVPATGDVLLQEDGAGEQFVRGVTRSGSIYDFAQTLVSDSEFCGGCFAPDGKTFFLNQQGSPGIPPVAPGTPRPDAVDLEGGLTYAIWGPFESRRVR